MKILMVASEAAPFAKTGGLADVIGSLPAALSARGEQVGVVLPLYRVSTQAASGAERVYDNLDIPLSPRYRYRVSVRRLVSGGVTFFFIDCPELFDRPALYGEGGADYPDNHVRFAVLCRAALGVVRFLFRPDIVHCHDWQSGLVAPLIRRTFRGDPTFAGIGLLMTIHNIGYQGLFPPAAMADIGMDRSLLRPDAMEFWGRVNYLKAGLVFSDAISTVSERYAQEIQTEEFGFGLDGLLRARGDVLSGIVNGVDYSEWDPCCDSHISAMYTAEDLSGKQACKRDLLRAFGLPVDATAPVVGIVSRFVSQKGFDLLEECADDLMSTGCLLTAIGTGEPQFETLMLSLADRYPDRAAVRIAYDNTLAHKIEAGADIFLMPSRYEPCGLNQIYSLRYGTVPVVRATGGLDDTVDETTGFKFQEYSAPALMKAFRSAVASYRERNAWQRRIIAGMRKDYSWDASAERYSALYRRISLRGESFLA